MSLKPELFRYLDQFGHTYRLDQTLTPRRIRGFLTSKLRRNKFDSTNWIALRHDIDHDLDLALELAHHEHARGIRATYFLLHTAPYWNDPDLLAKCRQLHAYGHEVGLHLDLVTEYAQGLTTAPQERVSQLLSILRSSGVPVKGVAAHGAKACYEHQCTNYWFWKELRPADPMSEEDRRSAEGIQLDDSDWQIRYPDSHKARIGDADFDLWSVSMNELGIEYEASALHPDHYWTDTGGEWSRSPDPSGHDLSTGTHVVLIHPIWWRGPKKVHFVVCPNPQSRSALAQQLDTATSAIVLDEWTMTRTRVGRSVDLADSLNAASPTLIQNAIAHHLKLLDADVVEFTSLLPAQLFHQAGPDQKPICVWTVPIASHSISAAAIDLLEEHPSLYQDPQDQALVPVKSSRWEWMSRLQRAVAHTKTCRGDCVEAATNSDEYLSNADSCSLAKQLGFVWHPLLAEECSFDPEVIRSQHRLQPHSLWKDGKPVYKINGTQFGLSISARSCSVESARRSKISWEKTDGSAPQASIEFRSPSNDQDYLIGQLRVESCTRDPIRVFFHSWIRPGDDSIPEKQTIDLGMIKPSDEEHIFRFACSPAEGTNSIAICLLAPKDHRSGSMTLRSLEIRSVDLRLYRGLCTH